jgi:hypothetical protein
MKKPDRFQREVDEHNGLDGGWMRAVDVIGLLRDQHQAVMRMVRKEKRELVKAERKTRQSTDPRDILIADCLKSRVAQCTDVLTKLKERKR